MGFFSDLSEHTLEGDALLVPNASFSIIVYQRNHYIIVAIHQS